MEEFVAALELFVLYLDGLDTVNNGHQTCSQSLSLPGGTCVSIARAAYAGCKCETYSMRLRRASSPSFSITSLVLLGLMLRTSSGSYSSSPGAISTRGLSRGIIMVPLLLRLPSLGLLSRRPRVGRLSSLDDVVDRGGESDGFDGGSLKASTGAESMVCVNVSDVMVW